MLVHYNIDELPSFRRAVITIGTFDGVHTGHTQLLQQLKEEAARIQGETVIITFHPHPRKVVNGAAKEIRLINTLHERIGLLSAAGIDHLVVVPFTEAFSQQTPSSYIEDFLLGRFHPHTIIIGYDHQFGKDRAGDYHLLEQYSRSAGYELKEIPVHVANAISVSSTRIREAIMQSSIETANGLLGYPFFFTGVVRTGNKLGRTIGYPTANLQVVSPEKLLPGDGVYAVRAELGSEGGEHLAGKEDKTEISGRWSVVNGLKGMMNVGLRPTVDGLNRVIEVNLFDFSGDIYEKLLTVHLVRYLRGEKKFAGLDALKEQLAQDRAAAIKALD